ncbi:Uncharacterised protein [uncultured archaeon]|nr:Uncharacterised protein [uncultured archaeon]
MVNYSNQEILNFLRSAHRTVEFDRLDTNKIKAVLAFAKPHLYSKSEEIRDLARDLYARHNARIPRLITSTKEKKVEVVEKPKVSFDDHLQKSTVHRVPKARRFLLKSVSKKR